MKISPQTKDSILFIGGCIGMGIFGGVMPLIGLLTTGDLGAGFNLALFGAWATVAGAGFFASLDSRKDKD